MTTSAQVKSWHEVDACEPIPRHVVARVDSWLPPYNQRFVNGWLTPPQPPRHRPKRDPQDADWLIIWVVPEKINEVGYPHRYLPEWYRWVLIQTRSQWHVVRWDHFWSKRRRIAKQCLDTLLPELRTLVVAYLTPETLPWEGPRFPWA